MKKLLVYAIVAIILAGLNFCSPKRASQTSAVAEKGLKDYYKDYFTVGVAVTPRDLKSDAAKLIVTQFKSVTAENAMKMGPIHPR